MSENKAPLSHTVSLSLNKALLLLGCFRREAREWSLADLSRALRLSKATVLRLARTLETRGFLSRSPNDRYQLGFELVRLANVLLEGLDLRSLAGPALQRLVARFDETTYLALRQGWDVICVQRLDCSHSLRLVVDVGSASPLGLGSFGKSVLAYMAEADIAAVVSAAAAGQLPAGLADGRRLRCALTEVRQRGYALTTGERLLGVTGMSCPIFNHKGEPLGAICLSFSNSRFNPARVEEYAAALREECRSVSGLMGFFAWSEQGPPMARPVEPLLKKGRPEPHGL